MSVESVLERLEASLELMRVQLEGLERRMAPAPTAVTFVEAARMLSVSSKYLGQLVRAGKIRTCLVGSVRRIPVAEIHAMLAAPAMRSSGATPARVKYDARAAMARLAELRRR